VILSNCKSITTIFAVFNTTLNIQNYAALNTKYDEMCTVLKIYINFILTITFSNVDQFLVLFTLQPCATS